MYTQDFLFIPGLVFCAKLFLSQLSNQWVNDLIHLVFLLLFSEDLFYKASCISKFLSLIGTVEAAVLSHQL